MFTIFFVILVIVNLVAFYKVERLVKVNKWLFPFFHLIIGYLILGLVYFVVSLFFNFTSTNWLNNQLDTNRFEWSINTIWGNRFEWDREPIWVKVAGYQNENYAKKEFIQNSVFYVLYLIGTFLPLIYFTYLLTRLAWLKWYLSILWLPIINIFYYPYLFLRISKKFKKWVGSALLLLFFEPIYFPVLILWNKENYLWINNNINLSKKEIGIVYWVMLLFLWSLFITTKSLKTKLNNARNRAIYVANEMNIMQISTALKQYYIDKWEYPESLNKNNLRFYISTIPKNPVTNKEYWYISLYYKWEKNNWAILYYKPNNEKKCNLPKSIIDNIKVWKIKSVEEIEKNIYNEKIV